jgi:starch-binding outer membrane protein, SusD/RagB family
MTHPIQHRLGRRATAYLTMTVLCTGLAAAGCRDITTLQQENPSNLTGKQVFVPGNAKLIATGAVSDLECAYSHYALASGLFTDELGVAIASTPDFEMDSRSMPTNNFYGTNACDAVQFPGVYTPLSVARASGDTAAAAFEGWTDEQVPNRSLLIAQASYVAGYSLDLLGESMCSAAVNLGPELTPAQLFALAVTRFDTAVAAATRSGDATSLNIALLGRARAELNAGDPGAAAADASQIPDGFEYDVSADAINIRRQNPIWSATKSNFLMTVEQSFVDLYNTIAPGDTTKDPRIASTNTGQLGTAGDSVVFPNKDASATAPIAIAKWSEAQLIIAENDVDNSNLAGAIAIINELKHRAGLSPYAGAVTAPAVLAQIVEERRRELWLEGHRLGDLRRYNLPFSPAAGTPYPFGGVYGNQTCFPLPDIERINNPNIGGTG